MWKPWTYKQIMVILPDNTKNWTMFIQVCYTHFYFKTLDIPRQCNILLIEDKLKTIIIWLKLNSRVNVCFYLFNSFFYYYYFQSLIFLLSYDFSFWLKFETYYKYTYCMYYTMCISVCNIFYMNKTKQAVIYNKSIKWH